MSFGLHDLLAQNIIKKKLKFLRDNPEHLNFLLCSYPPEIVGIEFIKQAAQYVIDNKIHTHLHYNIDNHKEPSISIISHGSESENFIGDAGSQQIVGNHSRCEKNKPIVIAEWDVNSYDGEVITVSPEYSLNEKLWPGLFIKNGDFITSIDSIPYENKICLKDEVPENTPLKGWSALTGGYDSIYKMGASIDEANIDFTLTTYGEPSIHRLISLILRYVIKSSRLAFDQSRMQNIRMSYQPMMLSDEHDMKFVSSYRISGKFTDHWLESIVDTPDKAATVGISLEPKRII